MKEEQIRKEFEAATETDYEGDFAKYANGDYVSEQQQDDYIMWKSGYEAGKQKELLKVAKDALGYYADGNKLGSPTSYAARQALATIEELENQQ